MAKRTDWGLPHSAITPEEVYLNRRKFMQGTALLAATAVLPNPEYALKDAKLTKPELATSYNNFYEFSLEKGGVKPLAEKWKIPSPWKVEVTGLTDAKRSYTLEELVGLGGPLEERVYRFRCVEAWSMVVPWTGFPLYQLITKLKPKKEAKYVAFTSYANEKEMPNIKAQPHYPWPYTEGLRMDEAMHPLTLMATGLYGKPLPGQNGAPMRLVVPWKYGFKSIKSVVKIEFSAEQPKTLWNQLAPDEYGFYANVNPEVAHPRWSQASERVLDGKLFPTRIKTLKFNGYEKEVAGLYKDLDLKKNY
ncbi:MAG: protein-methionine-sulfoxide reductase catalytic subunit MsrP [Bdellovibrionales bacterium]|nr:protein-methionine-sulfoxide reductase catalytic subunit MsrP [Bdellovibrionales bacterium]